LDVRKVKYQYQSVVETLNSLQGKVYISFDIDSVDPAFAPGTGTPEVGGMTSFEALEIIRSLKLDLIGFDVVEVAPPYDVSELTSMLAANLIYEAMSVVAKRRRR